MATCTLAAYPERLVTIAAAGGPTDKVACDLAEVLRNGLSHQTVLVENVGGGWNGGRVTAGLRRPGSIRLKPCIANLGTG